jgi:hypothetical protein
LDEEVVELAGDDEDGDYYLVAVIGLYWALIA